MPHVFLAGLAVSRTYARKYTHAPNRVIRPVGESGRRPNYHRWPACLPAVLGCLFIVGSWLVTTHSLCSLLLASGGSAQWQQPCVPPAGCGGCKRSDVSSRWFSHHRSRHRRVEWSGWRWVPPRGPHGKSERESRGGCAVGSWLVIQFL